MIDGIIKADGTSRLVQADLPATYEEFRAMAAAGSLPLDVLFNAAGWSQQPTFLNKAALLKDATAALFGLDASAVPDDVLAYLGKYSQHWWRRKAAQNTIIEGNAGLEIIGVGKFSYSIIYSSTIDVDWDNLTIALGSGEKYLTISDSNFFQYETLLAPLSGMYVKIDGVIYRYLGYEYDADYDGDGNEGLYISLKTLTPVNTLGDWMYVRSNNKDDYPEDGTSGDFYYQYLGVPFDNAVLAVSIDQLAAAIQEGVDSI